MSADKNEKKVAPGQVSEPETETSSNSLSPSVSSFVEEFSFNIARSRTATAEPHEYSGTSNFRRNKPFNLLNSLASRQTGCLMNHVFERDVLKQRSMSLRLNKESCVPDFNQYFAATLKFLRVGVNSIHAIWNFGTNGSNVLIGEMEHEFTPSSHHCVNELACLHDEQIVDVLEDLTFERNIILAVNNMHENDHCKSGLYLIVRPSQPGNKPKKYAIHPCYNFFMKSISFHFHTFTMALSEDRNIRCYRLNTNLAIIKQLEFEAISLKFNKQGSLLYSGISNGQVIAHDLRVLENAYQLRLDSYAVSDLMLLSNENYLLCGTVNGQLVKVDLRMKAVVLTYSGHQPTVRKNPFSVSEEHHLLCATGSDNITRLWSLKAGGPPLRSFVTPGLNNDPYHSVLVSNSSKCLIYQVQRNRVYTSVYGCD